MREFIIEQLRTLKVKDDDKLVEYVDYCLDNAIDKPIKFETNHHHILPKADKLPFTKYIDLRKNKWNGVHLLHEHHFMAHSLLALSISNQSVIFGWKMLSSFQDGIFREKITSDEYSELMERASRRQSELMKFKFKYTDLRLKISKTVNSRTEAEKEAHSNKLIAAHRAIEPERKAEMKELRKKTIANRTANEQILISKNMSESQKRLWQKKTTEDRHKFSQKMQQTYNEQSDEYKLQFSKRTKLQQNKLSQHEKQLIQKKRIKTLNTRTHEEKEKTKLKRKLTNAAKTDEEKQAIARKFRKTMNNKTDEEKQLIYQKTRETMNNKSPEEKRKIREKLSLAHKGKKRGKQPTTQCIHCLRFISINKHTQWHGDKCSKRVKNEA